ncbi:adenosylcobinamide-GDP ribazoletransferase [Trichloromonas sp.]|uniref:adenosylcobinamide-GDP ribazoletransferase n=1 Tax=Trichloromonas sp. TaxID=3069249 RepID=UPI002A3B8936|nr:adenosylcobinamide-GDP ribazoletransferase [Trichloromonas sp.]
MKRWWEEFRMAGGFLTVFPVADNLSGDAERLGRGMAFWPAVGLLMGLGLVAMDQALTPIIPRAVVDSLLVLTMIAITGAVHLDGIADLCDGLAGGKDREGTLRIMKESRVGPVGVSGLVMVLLLKYVILHNVPFQLKAPALIFMPMAGRWIQVLLAAYSSYIPSGGGTGGTFVEHVGGREFAIASATFAIATLILFGLKGLALLLVFGLVGLALLRYFHYRLGGVTGDVLGAGNEVMEIFALLLVHLLRHA